MLLAFISTYLFASLFDYEDRASMFLQNMYEHLPDYSAVKLVLFIFSTLYPVLKYLVRVKYHTVDIT